VITVTNHY